MEKLVAEFLGTMILVLLGESCVANACLKKSGMHGAGPLFIALGWGCAVLIPAMIFSSISGAVFNPVLALIMYLKKDLSILYMLGYVLAELIGAFCGAILVYILFKKHIDEEEDPSSIFFTSPSVRNYGLNLVQEAIATFILIFSLLSIPDSFNVGISNVFVFFIISSIGMSFGGLTGYAINPARDLGPRLAYTILPIKNKNSDFKYAFVPVVGPIIGGLLAYLLTFII